MRWSMKRCWISRGSATIGWFRNSKRYYVKTRRPGSFPHAKLGAGIPDIALPEGIEPFDKGETQDGAHGEDTGAEELDGRSASNTCRDALPMSPLMDPSFFEGREKHHKPKAPPSQEPTPFQQQLAKNPYALALATSIRHCSATNEVLPRFFLDDYTLLPHPETGKPCWVPRGLTRQHADSHDEETEVVTLDDTPNTAEPNNPHHAAQLPTPIHEYILSRRPLLSAFQITKSSYDSVPKSLGRLMRAWEGPRKLVSHANFREDMDTFVLELMRRRIVESLAYLVQRKKGYVTGCRDWEDAKRRKQVAAMLWTVDPEREEKRSPEFGTLRMRKGKAEGGMVPVYDLWRLLGEEHLGKLRAMCENGLWESDVLVLKHKRVTVETQLKLWKLEGYLATYKEPGPVAASAGKPTDL